MRIQARWNTYFQIFIFSNYAELHIQYVHKVLTLVSGMEIIFFFFSGFFLVFFLSMSMVVVVSRRRMVWHLVRISLPALDSSLSSEFSSSRPNSSPGLQQWRWENKVNESKINWNKYFYNRKLPVHYPHPFLEIIPSPTEIKFICAEALK